MKLNHIHQGDVLEVLRSFPSDSVDCCITSPPYYGMRDYGVEGQIGLEATIEDYFAALLAVTAEIHRVLKPAGSLWWNHGDCYGGPVSEPNAPKHGARTGRVFTRKSVGRSKSLCLQNYRLVAEMCDAHGWYLRNVIIWYKPSCMPSSVTDRFTIDFEPVFFLTKSNRYYFETQREPVSQSYANDKRPKGVLRQRTCTNSKYPDGGQFKKQAEYPSRNYQGFNDRWDGKDGDHPDDRIKRCVWAINTASFSDAHFATFPEELVETPLNAGCPVGGIVLDPFMGSGTTALVALKHGRNFVGIELNPAYIEMAERRLEMEAGLLWYSRKRGVA